ncbi:hypothetical protein AXX16_3203 [Serratia rubidaea]|nr:hypothetical protein AXX16_3203 [Serratia rubidaea]
MSGCARNDSGRFILLTGFSRAISGSYFCKSADVCRCL